MANVHTDKEIWSTDQSDYSSVQFLPEPVYKTP